MKIIAERLELINSTPQILTQILEGNEALASFLHIHVPDKWSEFGDMPFTYALRQIEKDPDSVSWWSWLPILRSENMLIGNCGYKGPPKAGVVEIGYEVAELYRGQGYATEIASALIDHAFTFPAVSAILAHTLAEENASVHVLRRCGFEFVGDIEDPDDGPIWCWSLIRPRI